MEEIRRELDAMGIDLMEPESKREETMAQALEAFSVFVLEDEKEACQEITEKHMGATVGALQGGSEEDEIYRVHITETNNESKGGGGGGAAAEWIEKFHNSPQGRRYTNTFTIDRLQQYMLGMCDRRTSERGGRKYTKLGNFMFILSFGVADGQVRHIDSMTPNLQLCLYMSRNCPSTVAYSTGDGPDITNAQELLEHWEQQLHHVPPIVKTILQEQANTPLKQIWHTKYFAFWDTINTNLNCFGKLYQPVIRTLSLKQTDPGTMLIAGGNEVHAGPRTTGPRMFAFAIGIPDEEEEEDNIYDNEDNDGEVQYTPVQLHVDLCCILFSFMEFEIEYANRRAEHHSAKLFLLRLLLPFIHEYPNEKYDRLMGDNRSEVRSWLGRLVDAQHSRDSSAAMTVTLMNEAIASETMFYGPVSTKIRRAKMKKQQKYSGNS